MEKRGQRGWKHSRWFPAWQNKSTNMHRTSLREMIPVLIANRILATLVFAFLFPHRAAADDSPNVTGSLPTSFSYELVGIARFDGVSYASLVDPQTGYHFLLSTVTQSEQGIVLTSVQTNDDPSGPSAIIQKDGVSVLVALDAGISLAPASQPSSAALDNSASGNLHGNSVSFRNLKPPPGATLPLIFQEVDPKKMTLTDEQKATLNQLRQDFIKAVNGTSPGNANGQATSPSTNSNNLVATSQNATTGDQQLQNWESAQEQSDERFRMLYGTQAFLAYQESSSYPAAP